MTLALRRQPPSTPVEAPHRCDASSNYVTNQSPAGQQAFTCILFDDGATLGIPHVLVFFSRPT